MRFVIDGPPIPKLRPRFKRLPGYVLTYDPQTGEKELFRDKLTLELNKAFNSENKEIALEASNLAFGKVFAISVHFHMPIPKSVTQARRNEILWGLEDEHITKPDLDNLFKFLGDCCNGILFSDDMHIYLLKCTKIYANKPKTIIDIMSKKNLSINDKARGILQIFGPEQLIRLYEDVKELFELYNVDEEDDWVAFKVGQENAREVRLARTAYLLSIIATNHAKSLEKIERKFPGFWKDAEKIEREVKASQNGEFNVLEEEKPQSTSVVYQATND